jgi:hypothetical protein
VLQAAMKPIIVLETFRRKQDGCNHGNPSRRKKDSSNDYCYEEHGGIFGIHAKNFNVKFTKMRRPITGGLDININLCPLALSLRQK